MRQQAIVPPLSEANLGLLPAKVRAPSFDMSRRRAGMLHFGVGNFHRAHQAVYLHRLFEMGRDHDWGIVGAGVLASEIPRFDTLKAQDCLYTLVEQAADRSSARIVASLVDYIRPGNADAIIAALARPEIRIVSLTITEGGYFIDPAGARFNAAHPDIVADSRNPGAPKTVFGLIAAGLKARRAKGIPAFTIMSCDNIPGNGSATCNAVTGLARLFDAELAGWIAGTVAFPDTMVDRITPATGAPERTRIREEFGAGDGAPVFCEDFTQWVMQDHFPAGRPALERAGVQFVADVRPFEAMKIGVLNGGHAMIAYPAALLGYTYIHEAMADPLIRGFVEKVQCDEVIAHLAPAGQTDPAAYLQTILTRFSNPAIEDTVARVCFDGSSRQCKFIIPSILKCLAAGQRPAGLALACALWCRYCFGVDNAGKTISPNDPRWDALNAAAVEAVNDPKTWILQTGIYGELAGREDFLQLFAFWLRMLWTEGIRGTLSLYLKT